MKRPIIPTVSMIFLALVWLNISSSLFTSVCFVMLFCVLGIVLVTSFVRFYRVRWLSISFCLVAVATLIFTFYESNYEKTTNYIDQYITITGQVADYPVIDSDNTYYNFKIDIEQIDGEEVSGKIIVYFKDDERLENLKAGETIELSCTAQEVYATTDMMQIYYKSLGCYLSTFSVSSYEVLREQNSYNPMNWVKNIRYEIKQTFLSDFDSENAGILISLLFGDKTQLSDELYEKFVACGLAHSMAISGLHMSIWVMFFMAFMKKFGIENSYTYTALMVIIFLVVIFADFTPSVLRAGLMLFIFIIAKLVKNDSNQTNALFLSAFVILLINPYCALDIRFLLSFCSTFAILQIALPIILKLSFYLDEIRMPSIFKKLLTVITSSALITISTTFFVLPITLYAFGQVSFVGVLSNLIFLALLAPMILLSGVYALVHDIPVLSTAINFVLSKLTDFSILVVEKLSSLKFAYYEFDSSQIIYVIIWSLAALAILFVLKNRRLFDEDEKTEKIKHIKK
ncbi:MAG: ComEC/Rec2 family competence protein [Clostridia bacterium]